MVSLLLRAKELKLTGNSKITIIIVLSTCGTTRVGSKSELVKIYDDNYDKDLDIFRSYRMW